MAAGPCHSHHAGVALAERPLTSFRTGAGTGDAGEFDYIIVGAGPAGCVLADRLSAAGDLRVLVIEAGANAARHEAVVPSLFPKLAGTTADWAYPLHHETGLDYRRAQLHRARLAGGAGSFDAGLFVREDSNPPETWEMVERRLKPGRLRGPNALSHAFVTAAVQYGIPYRATLEAAAREGAGFYRTTQRRGRRFGPREGYLGRARRRREVRTRFDARADRVVVEGGRAVAVEFVQGGRSFVARAQREVILSAGCIGTPRILLLSGIGPGATLSLIGIHVQADLPAVGQGLQVRPLVAAKFRSERRIGLDDQRGGRAALAYRLRGRGPLASNLFEAGAFVADGSAQPALQLLFAPTASAPGPGRCDAGFTIAATLATVALRGSVALRGPDPSLPPLIRTGLLCDDLDVRASADAANMVVDVAHQLGLAPFRGEPVTPDCEEFGSERWLRAYVEPFGPAAGTCRMDAGDGVTDGEFRVRGVGGLRIVDASVLGAVPAGASVAPVMALGEAAAAAILTRQPVVAMA